MELLAVIQDHLQHQGDVMVVNLERDFQVVQPELRHRSRPEDLGDQLVLGSE